jgi:hypothetical protein
MSRAAMPISKIIDHSRKGHPPRRRQGFDLQSVEAMMVGFTDARIGFVAIVLGICLFSQGGQV